MDERRRRGRRCWACVKAICVLLCDYQVLNSILLDRDKQKDGKVNESLNGREMDEPMVLRGCYFRLGYASFWVTCPVCLSLCEIGIVGSRDVKQASAACALAVHSFGYLELSSVVTVD